MTLSYAGLGIVSVRRSIYFWSDVWHGRVVGVAAEFSSLFFAFLLLVVVVVLAYLTNPTESSFRTFLTEQSFRYHLSRLDSDDYDGEGDHIDYSAGEDGGDVKALVRRGGFRTTARYPNAASGAGSAPPFHFANRASVSLRTPKHIFHSFGVCTVAAVVPFPSSNSNNGSSATTTPTTTRTTPTNPSTQTAPQTSSPVLDSFFIGIFGRWYRGGTLETWYRHAVYRSRDKQPKATGNGIGNGNEEEGWSSGILGFKRLDFGEYAGFPFSKPTSSSLPSSSKQPQRPPSVRGAPPKLRNRDRSTVVGGGTARSSTPPPLPKSASLPLHATRPPASSSSHTAQAQRAVSASPPLPTTSPLPSRCPSGLLDQTYHPHPHGHPHHPQSHQPHLQPQSPLITEVLRQISVSKSTICDLQQQLAASQLTAAESRGALQAEVDAYRERRRQEEAMRVELKGRTKNLEDAKRGAEALRREAEKRLKVAQGAREQCVARTVYLSAEIEKLEQRSLGDQAVIERGRAEQEKAEGEVREEVERRKEEVRVGEEVLGGLSVRVRGLEERIGEGRERLRIVRERAEGRRIERGLLGICGGVEGGASVGSGFAPGPGEVARAEYLGGYREADNDNTNTGNGNIGGATSHPRDLSRSPSRPARLSLGGISNFACNTSPNTSPPQLQQPSVLNTNSELTTGHAASAPAVGTKGYPIFDDDVVSLRSQSHSHSHSHSQVQGQVQPQAQQPQSINTSFSPFSPFGDTDSSSHHNQFHNLSVNQQHQHPGFGSTMDNRGDTLARSFQSENDVFLDKDWRGGIRRGLVKPSSQQPQVVDSISGKKTTTSPLSLVDSSPSSSSSAAAFNDQDPYPFEVRHRQPEHIRSESMNMQRATMPPNRTYSNPVTSAEEANPVSVEEVLDDKAGRRRWFSTSLKERPRKGLNPDAKVFRLVKAPNEFGSISAPAPPNPTYDALNPNGLGSRMMTASSSTTSSLLRAFAPSPAEREALQRALGGSTNPSLERLPSLSRVSSIPSSPGHVHASPAVPGSGQAHTRPNSLHLERGGEVGRTLPSWLQALPRISKSNFSPWDDDEPTSGGNGVAH